MTANPKLWSEVEDAMASGSVTRRGKIVRHITDLFIVGSAQCSEQEIELFDDVLTRLAAEIEVSARALLAVRLAPIPNAPPRIIRNLAFDDEIDVAGPVLEQSERLDEEALVENASRKGQEHLLAISRRRSLSEKVTDVLVERGDQQVVWSAVENRGAKFSEDGFNRLVRRSEQDERLAMSVGSRPEIPPHLFRRLLARASASVRIKLEAAHPQARREVRRAVTEVTQRIADEILGNAGHPGSSYVHALHQRGQLDDKRMETIAKTGRMEDIVTALALLAELPFDFVERAMKQERAEMVLIIAKAAALSWCTVKAILCARLGNREVPGGEIAKCLASYERLRAASAQEIVRFHRRRGGVPARRLP
ncbi:MAG TPA: DUF2336 domain-containing protein [Xanthobacteraceae bacterium]|nr:DUF2336 domain-containing protein [Xanthobacteraceae bacterium]